MNILIVYATNSGSTFLTAQRIALLLKEKNHNVTLQEVAKTDPNFFSQFDLILLGSPSWDYQGKEGQPHHDFIKFMDSHDDVRFPDQKFAIFGMGDKNYHYFCGAVDHLSIFVKERGGEVVIEPLRIDKYYCAEVDSCVSIDLWVEKLVN